MGNGGQYQGEIFIEKRDLDLNLIKRVRVTNEFSYQDSPCLLYLNKSVFVTYTSNETGNLDIFVKEYDVNLNFMNMKLQLTTEISDQNSSSLGYFSSPSPFYQGFLLVYQSWETGLRSNGDIFVKQYYLNWTEICTLQITCDSFYQDRPSVIQKTHFEKNSDNPCYIAYVSNETGNWDIMLQQLLPDLEPPSTLYCDYDGSWHKQDFSIILNATDDTLV